MKNSLNFRRLSLVVSLAATIALVSAPISIFAQDKGGSRMVGINAPDVQGGTAAVSTGMNCPKCKDAYVKSSEAPQKGAIASSKLVQSHLCGSCVTKVASAGQGKQAVDQVVHECSMAKTTTACCAMTKTPDSTSPAGQCPMRHE